MNENIEIKKNLNNQWYKSLTDWNNRPWEKLDEYRGTVFEGIWPSIPLMFSITASNYPKRKCFEAFSPTHLLYNYEEAFLQIKKIAKKLQEYGVKEGDNVAVVGKNSPEWALSYYGVMSANATIVPLDNGLDTATLNHLCECADVKFIFADNDKLKTINSFNYKLDTLISLEEGGDNPYITDWCKDISDDVEFFCNRSENDTAAILYTSGTTGFPKGVELTHKNFMSDAFLAQGNMAITEKDVFYALLPIHHSYTMTSVLLVSCTMGSAIVFGKKLVVSSLLSELKKGEVTMFLGVPMLFNKLIAGVRKNINSKGKLVSGILFSLMRFSANFKRKTGKNIGRVLFKGILKKLSMDKVRICISGGGPLPESTFKDFNALGLNFVQGYGMTETSPILTLNPIYAYVENSVGRLSPLVEMKIVDPDKDGNGIIYVRGPMVMKGYYKNPEATQEILSEDGWLCTGDVGHLDHNNYLYLTGRAKNLIVTEGGKNVFPEEIEDEFQLYDEIEQILVMGYTSDEEKKAEGIMALIKPTKEFLKNSATVVRDRMNAIVNEVNKRLASYKKITKVDITDESMPVSGTGKIKRYEVKKRMKENK